MKTRHLFIAAFAVSVLLCAGTVVEAEEGSGMDYFMTVESESVEIGGNSVVRSKSTGFVTGDAPFNMINQTCFGTQVTAADGTVSLNGHCDGYDADGDIYGNSYSGDATGGTWKFTGGTGKFAGIKGGGSWKAGHAFADGKWTAAWQGSWEKD